MMVSGSHLHHQASAHESSSLFSTRYMSKCSRSNFTMARLQGGAYLVERVAASSAQLWNPMIDGQYVMWDLSKRKTRTNNVNMDILLRRRLQTQHQRSKDWHYRGQSGLDFNNRHHWFTLCTHYSGVCLACRVRLAERSFESFGSRLGATTYHVGGQALDGLIV